MRLLEVASAVATAAFGATLAHMQLRYPAPRGDPKNPATGPPDYNLSSPMLSAVMCQGKPHGPPVATFHAGDTINVEFKGTARHGGGFCQFSISYDNDATFAVIQEIDGACPDASFVWPVKLPADLPSCECCTFAWTWVNAIGNREFYMNCADIAVVGTRQGSSVKGKQMFLANMPGYQTFLPAVRDGGPAASNITNYNVQVE